MKSLLLATLGLFAIPPALPCAQSDGTPDRKHGTVYKDEVDTLVGTLCRHARALPGRSLGGDSVRGTAEVLTAMGHCHRHYFYSVAMPNGSDGPLVKPSLDFLFQHRRGDGSFGNETGAGAALTTAWVCDALAAMDAEGFGADIARGRAWATANGCASSPWQAAVSAVLDQVRSDRFPQDLGAETAGADAAAGRFDSARAIAALVQLVACQAANRHLDQAQGPQAPAWSPAQQKGFDFLAGRQKDGVFKMKMGPREVEDPGFQALALAAMQSKPKAARSKDEQKIIDQGCKWLLEHQNEDGSFGQQTVNYETCAVIMALTHWGDPAIKPALVKAQAFVIGIQHIEQGGYQRSDRDYGSFGYGGLGGSERGDLSNTQFSIEALRLSGLNENNEAFAKAVVFLQRTQNLKSANDFKGRVPDEDNKLRDVSSGDDGGAVYYPGNSAAGYVDLPDGSCIPRSYGSMTYALLKSYTLAGVKADDPRVKAAVKWLGEHWTLAENPGADPKLPEKTRYQGLYYYYMVLAQALNAAKVDKLTVNKEGGKTEEVDWRKALRAHVESLQRPDGSWMNERNERWYESMDLLCTCYAMLGLEQCR